MLLTKFKKIIVVPTLVIMCIATISPVAAHAQDNNEEQPKVVVSEETPLSAAELEIDEDQPNIGVSTVCPDDTSGIQPYTATRPTKVWNIATKKQYNFSGTLKNLKATMYTNYKFKGKNTYTFKVSNKGHYSMIVKAKRLTKTYASATISAGKSATVTFSGIMKTTEFYLTFDGTDAFSGYIK